MTETDYGQPDTEEEEDVKPVRRRPKKRAIRVHRVSEDDSFPVVKTFPESDETLARKFVKDNYPRGGEVFLAFPDGKQQYYSADHEFQGHPEGGWLDFDEFEDERPE